MEVKIPEVVTIVELENAPFKNALCARSWALAHGVVGLMSRVDSGARAKFRFPLGLSTRCLVALR